MPKQTFFNLPIEKRSRIIEGAKEAFSKKHYNEVTIDTIVALSNIPKGSFYQYFINKDDLFTYIFQNIGIKKSNVLLEELTISKDLNFSELIIELIERANQFENQDEVMIGLKKRFLNECPQEVKNSILLDLEPQTFDLFEKIIHIFVEKGEFKSDVNSKIAAFILTTAVLNLDKFTLQRESDYGKLLSDICSMLEYGIKK